jgi:hypothetical protein
MYVHLLVPPSLSIYASVCVSVRTYARDLAGDILSKLLEQCAEQIRQQGPCQVAALHAIVVAVVLRPPAERDQEQAVSHVAKEERFLAVKRLAHTHVWQELRAQQSRRMPRMTQRQIHVSASVPVIQTKRGVVCVCVCVSICVHMCVCVAGKGGAYA